MKPRKNKIPAFIPNQPSQADFMIFMTELEMNPNARGKKKISES